MHNHYCSQAKLLSAHDTAVEAEEMKGQGAVTCLTSRSHAGRHRMLVLHEETGVTIWDLRSAINSLQGTGAEPAPTALLMRMSLLLQAIACQGQIGPAACCIQARSLFHASMQYTTAHNLRPITYMSKAMFSPLRSCEQMCILSDKLLTTFLSTVSAKCDRHFQRSLSKCRYECPVALARNETAEALAGLVGAKATCACWIGGQGICFAAGYSTSDICVWGLPGPVQQGIPACHVHHVIAFAQPAGPQQLDQLASVTKEIMSG